MDASVAAKWATPEIIEPLANQAHRFLRAYVDGAIQVVAPDLFWLEIGSFLWKAAKRGALTSVFAPRALEAMRTRDFPTVPSRAFPPSAFKIACPFDRTNYNSNYVA